MTSSTAVTPWDEETGEVFDAGDNDAELAPLATVSNGAGTLAVPEDGTMLATLVTAARSLKRDPKQLIERAKQIGGLLGSKGFYRFPMGDGGIVEGESVHLAQALAQEWGGMLYETVIVRAEPLASGGQRVHLRSTVADMVALVVAKVDHVITTSPPPGKFAKKHDQRERWHGMQIQSAGSKVERNAILDVLPKWFTQPGFEAAKAIANARVLGKNKDGTARTLAQARAAAIESLTPMGCTKEELEKYIGQPYEMWAVPQISQLRDLYADLHRGSISIEAWRASLFDEPQTAAAGPRRNALGLPASNGSGVDDAAFKAATEQKGEPEAAKAAKAPKQTDLPGSKA